MVWEATHQGTAEHIFENAPKGNGYNAWKGLEKWYNTMANARRAIDTAQARLHGLQCTELYNMAKYINDFIMTANRLEKLGETITNGTKQFLFFSHILDPEYLLVKISIDISVAKSKPVSFDSMVELVCSH